MANQPPKQVPNPTGKGGFQDHPELRSSGHWKKENSVSHWMHIFLAMETEEFRQYENDPERKRCLAESIAYARCFNARADLRETEFLVNRTEGYPKQPIDMQETAEDLDKLSEDQLDAKLYALRRATERKQKTGNKNTVAKDAHSSKK